MMAPRLMLVIAAVGITEADLSIPLRVLTWIATLLSLNIVRTLGTPSRTYGLPRNAIYVLFSITIHLRPILVKAKSPCVLDMEDFILTYNSAFCGDNLTSSTKLATRTVSAQYLGSVGRGAVLELYLGVARSAKSRVWLEGSCFKLDCYGCGFRRCRLFCQVFHGDDLFALQAHLTARCQRCLISR